MFLIFPIVWLMEICSMCLIQKYVEMWSIASNQTKHANWQFGWIKPWIFNTASALVVTKNGLWIIQSIHLLDKYAWNYSITLYCIPQKVLHAIFSPINEVQVSLILTAILDSSINEWTIQYKILGKLINAILT